jgi:hypothetical protein
MNSEIQQNAIPKQRSTFVNVLAWIFIVISGFTTFISILQNIMIRMMFHKEQISQSIKQAENTQHVPAFANFMFNYADLFFLLFLIVSVTSFVSAIALLKRKNWARVVFIILMSLGIAWNIIGMVLQFTMFNTLPEMAGRGAPPEFAKMMIIMKIAGVIMAIGISALFGWIIKKLTSQQIKAEFA